MQSTGTVRHVFDVALLSVAVLAGLFGVAYAATSIGNPDAGVAVVYAPWTSFDTAFRSSVGAGSRFVRAGGVPFVVVVVPEDEDFLQRARAGGAWLIAAPKTVGFCGSGNRVELNR